MSLVFQTKINEDKEIHGNDCTGFYDFDNGVYKYCDCGKNSRCRVYTINFNLMYEKNLISSFTRNFYIQQKDRLNLIRFVEMLTYTEISGENIIAGEDKKKIKINRNERLLYNYMYGIVTLHLNSSRRYNCEIEYHIKKSMISFKLSTNQCCDNCSCGSCEYYGRIINEENTTFKLNEITKPEIIKVLKHLIPEEEKKRKIREL